MQCLLRAGFKYGFILAHCCLVSKSLFFLFQWLGGMTDSYSLLCNILHLIYVYYEFQQGPRVALFIKFVNIIPFYTELHLMWSYERPSNL